MIPSTDSKNNGSQKNRFKMIDPEMVFGPVWMHIMAEHPNAAVLLREGLNNLPRIRNIPIARTSVFEAIKECLNSCDDPTPSKHMGMIDGGRAASMNDEKQNSYTLMNFNIRFNSIGEIDQRHHGEDVPCFVPLVCFFKEGKKDSQHTLNLLQRCSSGKMETRTFFSEISKIQPLELSTFLLQYEKDELDTSKEQQSFITAYSENECEMIGDFALLSWLMEFASNGNLTTDEGMKRCQIVIMRLFLYLMKTFHFTSLDREMLSVLFDANNPVCTMYSQENYNNSRMYIMRNRHNQRFSIILNHQWGDVLYPYDKSYKDERAAEVRHKIMTLRSTPNYPFEMIHSNNCNTLINAAKLFYLLATKKMPDRIVFKNDVESFGDKTFFNQID